MLHNPTPLACQIGSAFFDSFPIKNCGQPPREVEVFRSPENSHTEIDHYVLRGIVSEWQKFSISFIIFDALKTWKILQFFTPRNFD